MTPSGASGGAREATPVLPHLAHEFLLWLWWWSEERGGTLELGGELGEVSFWVDTRIVLRGAESRSATVLTGENPAASLEARAAVAGGKRVDELRLALKHEDRDYTLVLKAPHLDVSGLKLPQLVGGEGEEALYERMYLYEEVVALLSGLFTAFARQRVSPAWTGETLPAIRRWVREGLDSGQEEG